MKIIMSVRFTYEDNSCKEAAYTVLNTNTSDSSHYEIESKALEFVRFLEQNASARFINEVRDELVSQRFKRAL